jgi:hypothetical protein
MSIAGFLLQSIIWFKHFFLVAFSINSFKLFFFRFLSLWSDRFYILVQWKQQKKLTENWTNLFQFKTHLSRDKIYSTRVHFLKVFLYFYTFDVWWHQVTFSKKKVTALTFLIWLRRREKEFFNIIWFDWKAISWLLQYIVRLQLTFYRMYCKEIFIWSS